jgi:hypothetical protein
MGDKFEMSTGQAHELALAFGRNGWTNEDIKKLSEGNMLARVLDHILGKESPPQKYPVTVDYNLTIEQMIDEYYHGFPNCFDQKITTEHFPISGKGKMVRDVQVANLECHRTMRTYSVLQRMDQSGLRPATIEELLAFSFQWSLETGGWSKFTIVALGSVWRERHGECHVPCMRLDTTGNGLPSYVRLYLGDGMPDSKWDCYHCRFLAVSK